MEQILSKDTALRVHIEHSKPIEMNDFVSSLNIIVADQQGKMSIGAVNKAENGNVFNNCTFNFGDGNTAQNILRRSIDDCKSIDSDETVYRRVIMQIYQLRNDADTNTGNKAIIDDIFRNRKLPVVFESDGLKNEILFSEANPARMAFQVDVKVQTINGKPAAYKVIELHDIISIE